MKFTDLTRRALAVRREQRELERRGFRRHETDWEIHRGARYREVIVEARVSVCGKYVYTKLGDPVRLPPAPAATVPACNPGSNRSSPP